MTICRDSENPLQDWLLSISKISRFRRATCSYEYFASSNSIGSVFREFRMAAMVVDLRPLLFDPRIVPVHSSLLGLSNGEITTDSLRAAKEADQRELRTAV